MSQPTKLFAQYFERFPELEQLLAREFKYAELWQALQAEGRPGAGYRRNPGAGAGSRRCRIRPRLLVGSLDVSGRSAGRLQGHFPGSAARSVSGQDLHVFRPDRFRHAARAKIRRHAERRAPIRRGAAPPRKADLTDSRVRRRYQVRSQQGYGDIVYTTLLGKILTLVANKLATLDPFGVGIEMEADRPGWCDALNGLPGISARRSTKPSN